MHRENLRKIEYEIFNSHVNLDTRKSEIISIEKGEGYFHKFSINFEELNNGPGLFPVAIIEKEDGTLKLYAIDSTFCKLKFIT